MTINLDADLENADWTKTTWDLPARNITELRAWLEDVGMTPEAFKLLPVYLWNVDQMAWLQDL
jgi:hypothetical protein